LCFGYLLLFGCFSVFWLQPWQLAEDFKACKNPTMNEVVSAAILQHCKIAVGQKKTFCSIR